MSARMNPEHGPQGWSDDEQLYNARHPQMTICDGQGGVLSLDLTQPGLDELAHAFNALLESKLPPGACLLQVLAGSDIYLLRRVKRAPTTIGITRMGAQAQEVSLTEDVLLIVTRLLETSQHLRAAAQARGSSLVSFVI